MNVKSGPKAWKHAIRMDVPSVLSDTPARKSGDISLKFSGDGGGHNLWTMRCSVEDGLTIRGASSTVTSIVKIIHIMSYCKLNNYEPEAKQLYVKIWLSQHTLRSFSIAMPTLSAVSPCSWSSLVGLAGGVKDMWCSTTTTPSSTSRRNGISSNEARRVCVSTGFQNQFSSHEEAYLTTDPPKENLQWGSTSRIGLNDNVPHEPLF